MKKTYISISGEQGGAEQLLLQLAKNDLANSSVCFFKSKTSNIWEKSGISTYYCDGSIFKFFKFFVNKKFDFIFSTHLMINAFLGFLRFLGFLKTEKLVCRESTSVFGRYKGGKLFIYKIAYWVGYRSIDLLITQSDLMKNVLIKNLPYLDNRIKIKTIPNLFVLPNDEVVNEKINVKENSIIAAGRLIPEKGFDILIDVFSELTKKYPELHLIILGEGSQRPNLEQQIKKAELKDRVQLLGFVKNVYPYFKKAKICVMSSRKEGFPNVLLQMMSQNERVVSTLCAGGIDSIKGIEICNANDKPDLLLSTTKCIEKELSKERDWFDTELSTRTVTSFFNKINNCI